MNSDAIKILAGDIGGTKTILQVVESRDGKLISLYEKRYESQQFDTFERILSQFFSEFHIEKKQITIGCFGVAGPVTRSGSRTVSKITNLPWKLDSASLEDNLDIKRVTLINDFQAVGCSVECLGEEDFLVLQEGAPEENATKAVIGAGTGLGHAFLIWDDKQKKYIVMSSEAGHSSFSPTTLRERKLLEYLSKKNTYVSLEQVVSGPGITSIYHFLSQEKSHMPDEILLSANDSLDMTPTIVSLALQNENPLAVEALDIFLNAYGAAAGNLALTVGARGGVYIAGGIAPKIVEKLQNGIFMAAFTGKNKMKSLLESIPVFLITNEKAGLLGAAHYGLGSCSAAAD